MSRLSKLVLALCLAPFPAIGTAQPQSDYIPEFACEGGRFGLRLPNRLPDIMSLAPVKQEKVLELERWEDYTTTRKYVYFSGLTIGLIAFSNDRNRYMLSFAEITDPKWKHIAPFWVGEEISSARKTIGSPADGDPDLKVRYGSEAGDSFFESNAGRITKITYVCYTG